MKRLTGFVWGAAVGMAATTYLATRQRERPARHPDDDVGSTDWVELADMLGDQRGEPGDHDPPDPPGAAGAAATAVQTAQVAHELGTTALGGDELGIPVQAFVEAAADQQRRQMRRSPR